MVNIFYSLTARINENVDDGDMEGDNITFDDFEGSDDEIDDVSKILYPDHMCLYTGSRVFKC